MAGYDGRRSGGRGYGQQREFDRNTYNQPNALVEVFTTKRDHPMVSQTVEPRDDMTIVVHQRSEGGGIKVCEITIRPVGNKIELSAVVDGAPVEIDGNILERLAFRVRTDK